MADPTQKLMNRCPECDADLDELEDYELEVGDTVNCPNCAVELRITSASPLEVGGVE